MSKDSKRCLTDYSSVDWLIHSSRTIVVAMTQSSRQHKCLYGGSATVRQVRWPTLASDYVRKLLSLSTVTPYCPEVSVRYDSQSLNTTRPKVLPWATSCRTYFACPPWHDRRQSPCPEPWHRTADGAPHWPHLRPGRPLSGPRRRSPYIHPH